MSNAQSRKYYRDKIAETPRRDNNGRVISRHLRHAQKSLDVRRAAHAASNKMRAGRESGYTIPGSMKK